MNRPYAFTARFANRLQRRPVLIAALLLFGLAAAFQLAAAILAISAFLLLRVSSAASATPR